MYIVNHFKSTENIKTFFLTPMIPPAGDVWHFGVFPCLFYVFLFLVLGIIFYHFITSVFATGHYVVMVPTLH